MQASLQSPAAELAEDTGIISGRGWQASSHFPELRNILHLAFFGHLRPFKVNLPAQRGKNGAWPWCRSWSMLLIHLGFRGRFVKGGQ